jgi:hypothetical protein
MGARVLRAVVDFDASEPRVDLGGVGITFRVPAIGA